MMRKGIIVDVRATPGGIDVRSIWDAMHERYRLRRGAKEAGEALASLCAEGLLTRRGAVYVAADEVPDGVQPK